MCFFWIPAEHACFPLLTGREGAKSSTCFDEISNEAIGLYLQEHCLSKYTRNKKKRAHGFEII